MLVPWIPILIAFVLFATAMATFGSTRTGGASGGLIAVGVLMIPVVLVLLVFCSAKAITNQALISRLAFQDLMAQPESTATAWRQIRQRTWHFWLARFMVGLIVWAVSFGFSVLQNILTAIPEALSSGSSGRSALAMLAALIAVVILLASSAAQLWFQARLFVPELSIAMEENVSGDQSIVRAWSLSKGHSWRIAMIILVAGLITVPLFLLAFLPMGASLVALAASARPGVAPSSAAIGTFFGALALSVLLAFAISIFTMPFWQTIKAVIYYDLRSRREGMGLELRDR